MATLPELPYIPLEVEENIIDQLSGHVDSLRSCALTCRGWNRHARYYLMASICVQSIEDLYSIRDYFASNPRMSSFVRSISMSPTNTEYPLYLLEVLPVDLLKRLPNLQRYSVVGGPNIVSFHPTTLIHIKTYLLVEELYLHTLEFRTSAELARVLTSLPRLRRLECSGLNIHNMATGTPRFRNKCSKLSEVTILKDVHHIISGLIVQISLSTLHVLRCNLRYFKDSSLPADLSELKHLHSLELMTDVVTPSISSTFRQIVPVLTSIPSTLGILTISFKEPPRDRQTNSDRVGHPLEDNILALGTQSVVVSIPMAKHNKLALYSNIFQGYLPRLHEGNLLQVQGSSGDAGRVNLGHDAAVTAMAASLDGRYVASGARNDSIIIWSGTTSPERILREIHCPAESGGVCALHFSDTGEFLAGLCENNLLVWRIVDGVQITSIAGSGLTRTCIWRKHNPDHLTLLILDWGIHATPRSPYLSVTKVDVHHAPGTVTTSEPFSLLPHHIPAAYHTLFEHGLITQSSSGLCFALWNRSVSTCFVFRQMGESTSTYEVHQLDFAQPHSSPSCASFIGDAKLLISLRDGTIRWWDITSSPVTTIEPQGVLQLFPPGRMMSSLSVSPLHCFLIPWCIGDHSIPVLVRTHGRPQGRWDELFYLRGVLRGHTGPVNSVCFSPCERYIATASDDRTVRLWSTRDGELLWTFRDYSTSVSHVVFSIDGRILASADCGGKVCMHTLASFVRDAPSLRLTF